MKTSNKLLLAVLILILVTITVVLGALRSRFAEWDKSSISGNEIIKTETRTVSSFTGVSVCCRIHVNLKQGNDQKVEVVADENILGEIQTKVEDGVLKIYTARRIRKAEQMVVNITTGSVQYIELSSAAKLDTPEEITGQNLTIKSSSAANANIIIDYSTVNIDQSSGSELNLRGKADMATLENSSGGRIHANDLIVNRCRANASSGARTEINVVDEIDADASSGGSIQFEGDPSVKNVQSSSGGNVQQKRKPSASRKTEHDKTPSISLINLFSSVYKATL